MFEPAFLRHRGQEILKLDYSGLSTEELLAAFDRAGDVITAAPPASLRILTVLRSRMSEKAVEALQRHTAINKPHVKAAAVVGTAFWNVVVEGIRARGREETQLFDDEAAALEWLATTR